MIGKQSSQKEHQHKGNDSDLINPKGKVEAASSDARGQQSENGALNGTISDGAKRTPY
jgi:hypothetical protein